MQCGHGTSERMPSDPEAHLKSFFVGEIGCCAIRWQIQNHGQLGRKLARYFQCIFLGQRCLDETYISAGRFGNPDTLDSFV